MHEQREQHSRQHPEQRRAAEHEEKFFFMAQETHGRLHGLHAHEEQAEAEQPAPGVFLRLGPAKEGEQHA